MIGNDPAGYAEEKQRQLAELGYEDGGLEGEALVWIEGPAHFNDLMLGLAPMRPERLKLFDRRFGASEFPIEAHSSIPSRNSASSYPVSAIAT